jgi:hypothetical protein
MARCIADVAHRAGNTLNLTFYLYIYIFLIQSFKDEERRLAQFKTDAMAAIQAFHKLAIHRYSFYAKEGSRSEEKRFKLEKLAPLAVNSWIQLLESNAIIPLALMPCSDSIAIQAGPGYFRKHPTYFSATLRQLLQLHSLLPESCRLYAAIVQPGFPG